MSTTTLPKLVIIEDEKAIQSEILHLVEKNFAIEFGGFADDVVTAMRLIETQKPDIALLDIQLLDGNSFDVLQHVNFLPPQIIFITAYNQYAIKAIKFGALDYLLKPIDESELVEALQKALQKTEQSVIQSSQIKVANDVLHQHDEEHIILKTKNQLKAVSLKDILYCKGDGPYTFFHLQNGEKICISKPLKAYENLLPKSFFAKTHQSYLINISKIKKVVQQESIILINGEEIPISQRRRSFIIEILKGL